MKITILGSGGGRYVLATQILHTSGVWVSHQNKEIFIDPGPCALRDALSLKLPLNKLTHILITHQHLDHYGGVESVIESAYFHQHNKKNITLITNTCMAGLHEECDKLISKYHLSLLKKHVIVKPNDEYADDIVFKFSPTLHHEKYGVGVRIDFKDISVGYPSDTEYFAEFSKYYKDVDVLILHFAIMKKESNEFRHATKEDIKKMISKTRASTIILRHFAPPVINYGIERLSREFKEMFPTKKIIFSKDLTAYYI